MSCFMNTQEFDRCIVKITELQAQIEIEEEKLLNILNGNSNSGITQNTLSHYRTARADDTISRSIFV